MHETNLTDLFQSKDEKFTKIITQSNSEREVQNFVKKKIHLLIALALKTSPETVNKIIHKGFELQVVRKSKVHKRNKNK